MKGRRWVLIHQPEGAFSETQAELQTYDVGPLGPGELLVEHLYLSLDPGYRIWLNQRDWLREYTDGFDVIQAGQPLKGVTLSRVLKSSDPQFREGDIIMPGLSNWADVECVPAAGAIQINPAADVPLPAYLSVLGHTGLTGYFGALLVADVKPGERVLVSAAAGAVGSVAAQIARLSGAHVTGIAGSDEKVAWLVEELGLNAAYNRRSTTFERDLRLNAEPGFDVYFDNVGGPMLDLALSVMKPYGRVVICGLIDLYEAHHPPIGLGRYADILMKRLTVKGFGMFDYWEQHRQSALDRLTQWVEAGEIRYRVDNVRGLENAATAFARLFTGEHSGKLMVQIA